LNPEAIHILDGNGDPQQYLRAEVEMLEEVPDEKLDAEAVRTLGAVWEQLRDISSQLDEPKLPMKSILKLYSRWQVAELWESYLLLVQLKRANALAVRNIQEWIRIEKRNGKSVPAASQGDSKTAVPSALLNPFKWSRTVRTLQLDDAFWIPLLRLQAATDAENFQQVLLQMMKNELHLMQTRMSLKNLLDANEDVVANKNVTD